MANNRMYLKCSLCGAAFYLAKYYPFSGWYPQQQEQLGAPLNQFLEDHSACVKRDKDGKYDTENGDYTLHGSPTDHEINEGETFRIIYEEEYNKNAPPQPAS